MSRYLLSIILLCLAACSECYAGYTVVIREQITPQFILVQGVGKTETALNPGPLPTYPATVTSRICIAPDLYSADPLLRSEVWEDPAGTATSAELFAACPQSREQKAAEIRKAGAEQLTAMATPYLQAERETWGAQQREARTWLADHNAPVPMISTLAGVRGLTMAEMVGKIMENVALFEAASGYILGIQQKLLDRIDAETDFAALLAIGWGN